MAEQISQLALALGFTVMFVVARGVYANFQNQIDLWIENETPILAALVLATTILGVIAGIVEQ